jgi:hypothetical protein
MWHTRAGQWRKQNTWVCVLLDVVVVRDRHWWRQQATASGQRWPPEEETSEEAKVVCLLDRGRFVVVFRVAGGGNEGARRTSSCGQQQRRRQPAPLPLCGTQKHDDDGSDLLPLGAFHEPDTLGLPPTRIGSVLFLVRSATHMTFFCVLGRRRQTKRATIS